MQFFSKYIISFALCMVLSVCVMTHSAFAVITETQSLSFGTFALTDNSVVYNMQILTSGAISANSHYVIVVDGQEALYDVSGFPATTALTVSVTSGDLSLGGGGGGELFNIVNFQHFPGTPVTDASGDASFSVGATMQSSGTGTMHIDGLYTGTGTITVNF